MTSGIRLGRVFGAPIVADASAFVLALLFGVVVLIDLRTSELSDGDAPWLLAVGAGLAIIGSVLVHELSHVVVAARRGLHVRAIRLYMFGGYSVIDGKPSPTTELLVAAAGPGASIVVGAILWGVATIVGTGTAAGRALFAVALANVAIGAFNLLPGFPLDGGRFLRGALAARSGDRVAATRAVARIGQWIGYAAIGAGLVLLVRRYAAGLFVLVGGWYLVSSAASAGRREMLSASFDGMTVADAMRPTPEAVSGRSTIAAVLDLYAIGPRLRSLPVEVDGHVVGVIGQDEIDALAPSRWPNTRVVSRMTEIGPSDVVDADSPLETLLVQPAGRSGRAVVTRHGTVVGIIEGADLARVLPD